MLAIIKGVMNISKKGRSETNTRRSLAVLGKKLSGKIQRRRELPKGGEVEHSATRGPLKCGFPASYGRSLLFRRIPMKAADIAVAYE